MWSLLTPIILIAGLAVIWRTRFVGPTAFTPDLPFLLYERMERWAIRLGFRPYQTHTPYEQAQTLSQVLPEGKPQIDTITDTYVRYRFSPEQGDASQVTQPAQPARPPSQSSQVIGAWQKLQPMLLRFWLHKGTERLLSKVGLQWIVAGRKAHQRDQYTLHE